MLSCQSPLQHNQLTPISIIYWDLYFIGPKPRNINIELWNLWIARRTCVSIFRDPGLVAMQHESDEDAEVNWRKHKFERL